MDLGIRDRTAIVAAASRGLGRAVAEALAAEGARVALCSRQAAAAERAAEEIRAQHGGETFGAAVDVTDQAAVEHFVGEVRSRFGPVEICVANCGGPPGGTFEDFGPEDWKRAFELSFLSTLYLIRAVLPGMKERGWGRVVTITSVSVRQPLDGLILSNAIRASVVGLIKSLANEFGRYGVLFNNLGPGLTATERLMGLAGRRAEQAGKTLDETIEQMASGAALNRVAQPEEFAAAAAFLCSERASYITGQTLLVDGGLSKGI